MNAETEISTRLPFPYVTAAIGFLAGLVEPTGITGGAGFLIGFIVGFIIRALQTFGGRDHE